MPRPELIEFVEVRRVIRSRACELRCTAVYRAQANVLDPTAVAEAIARHPFRSVIHFAAFKAVGESVANPLLYYSNNIAGLITLLKLVVSARVPNFIFSSSATVYGEGLPPFTESSPTGTGITNPYGQTKFMAEQILRDVQKVRGGPTVNERHPPTPTLTPLPQANPEMRVALLRYFNPVGAHPSGTMGEDPQGVRRRRERNAPDAPTPHHTRTHTPPPRPRRSRTTCCRTSSASLRAACLS